MYAGLATSGAENGLRGEGGFSFYVRLWFCLYHAVCTSSYRKEKDLFTK